MANPMESTPEVNSAAFFGIEPGTPEEAAFNQDTLRQSPDNLDRPVVDYLEDYQPSIRQIEPYSLSRVSLDDQRRIKQLMLGGMAAEAAVESVLSDFLA